MENRPTTKEIELAKRGVDAFVDRANELHHQRRYMDAFKQLERARKLCEKKLGPMHLSTIKVLFILSSMHEADGSMRKPTDFNLHFVFFDQGADTYKNYFAIASILRIRIFVNELAIPSNLEFDSFDHESRHALALFGDAPVAYGRWRIDQTHLIIDRLCILPGYRNRGIAKNFLKHMIQDASQHIINLKLPIDAFEFHLPKKMQIWLHRFFQRAKFVPFHLSEGNDSDCPSYNLRFCISTDQCNQLLAEQQ